MVLFHHLHVFLAGVYVIFSVPLLSKADSIVKVTICPNGDQFGNKAVQKTPCLTLEELANRSINSSTLVFLLPGHHYLQTYINVSNISELVITGASANTTNISCSEPAAFSFYKCSNITLQNLTISGCGLEASEAAITFQCGRNVNMTNVVVLDSIHAAFRASNVEGVTSLSNCKLSGISPGEYNGRGSGVFYDDGEKDALYQFKANKLHYSNYKNFNTNSTPGFTVMVKNCVANVKINNSEFSSNYNNNTPGGNMRILLEDLTKPSQVYVHLENVDITQGKAFKGGGMYINVTIHSSFNDSSIHHSLSRKCNNTLVTLKNVSFHNNNADVLGGGLYVQLSESLNASTCQSIELINCNFTGNSVNYSKNVGIALHSNSYILRGYLIQIMPQFQTILKGCFFANNSNTLSNSTRNSVVIINAHKNFRIDSIIIENNLCNAITAINSNLVFSGSTLLSGNKGSSGGGLLLCENAILFFIFNTYLEITNNTVEHAGGGICVQPQCLEARPRCFFQLFNPIETNNISVVVKHNQAKYAGDDIFGGDVDYCYLLDSSKTKKELYHHDSYSLVIFNYLFDHGNNSVTSPAREAVICGNTTFFIYPGQTFTIAARLEGQLNGQVPGVVKIVSDLTRTTVNGSLSRNTFETNKTGCGYVDLSINASASTYNLTLVPDHSGDTSGFENLFPTGNNASVTVTIKSCPVGTNSTAGHCTSAIPGVTFDMHRGSSNGPIVKFDSTYYWIQYNYTSDTLYCKSFCPLDYCKESKNVTLSQLIKKCSYEYPRCHNNRSGILCGECMTNYSVILGSNECRLCRDNFLNILLPIALAGVALVIFLTFFNLTVSKGTLSGLIFYANVIKVNSSSLLPSISSPSKHKDLVMLILKIFIGWLNLDLAIPVCLYDGMTPYVKAWLDFVFPIYIWFLAFLIITLSNKYQCIAKLASKNATKVLATLILLSYARFLQAIIFNFSFITYEVYLHMDNATREGNTSDKLWLTNPNMKYLGYKHSILFAFSFLFALLCGPFMLLLLFIKPLHRYSHLRPFKWIIRLKPFLDAFTGPYTDNGRFWPGMLMVARIVIMLTTGMNFLNDPVVRLGITTFVLMLLFLVASLVRPGLYVKKRLDYLEYFFLVNLWCLCLAKGYTYHHNVVKDPIYNTTFKVLGGLAFFTFVGIIVYHVGIKFRQTGVVLKAAYWIVQKYTAYCEHLFPQDINNQSSLENYPPHDEFVHQRDPLIADHEE